MRVCACVCVCACVRVYACEGVYMCVCARACFFVEARATINGLMRAGKIDQAMVSEDVERLDGAMLKGADITTGGFPCQDVACVGLQLGMFGKRTILVKHLVRIAKDTTATHARSTSIAALITCGSGGGSSGSSNGHSSHRCINRRNMICASSAASNFPSVSRHLPVIFPSFPVISRHPVLYVCMYVCTYVCM